MNTTTIGKDETEVESEVKVKMAWWLLQLPLILA